MKPITKDYCMWAYLTMGVPAGADPANVVCLYKFNKHTEGLLDRSGNGHNQTNVTGTDYYAPSATSYGISGLEFRDNYYIAGPTGLYPGTTGVFTLEFIWTPQAWTDATDFIVSIGGDDEAEANNITFQLQVRNAYGQFILLHEYGSGANAIAGIPWTGTTNETQHVAVTRSADSLTYKIYLNGEHVYTHVMSNAMTGGNGSGVRVRIGGSNSSNDLFAMLHSLRYAKELYDDDQIWESYLDCRVEQCPFPEVPYPPDLEDEPESYLKTFDFPLRFKPNCDVVKTRDEKAINDNIKISSFVRKYGLPLYPLGVGVEEFCFEPMDAPTQALLSAHLKDGIDLGVDGIVVNGDIRYEEHENENRLRVAVPYVNTKVGKNKMTVLSVPKTKVE